jgi:hypothetical protein
MSRADPSVSDSPVNIVAADAEPGGVAGELRGHASWWADWRHAAARAHESGSPVAVLPQPGLPGEAYAARRVYRRCNPPSSGSSTTFPISGGSAALGSGESFSSDK